MLAGEFANQVKGFADEISDLIRATVKGISRDVEVTLADHERATIALVGTPRARCLVAGRAAAEISVLIGCRVDSEGRYLAVTNSGFALYATLDRTPIVRLEYADTMRSAPSCHWQIHAERGALSHLLTLSRRQKPHMLSGLHFPVGGARFRPGLEDFLQFAIEECGLDAVDEYETALAAGREMAPTPSSDRCS